MRPDTDWMSLQTISTEPTALARELDWSLLPPMFIQLREIVGPEPALTIIARHGGKGCYVPKAAGPDHPLALLLGSEATAALCRAYGGQHVELPRLDAALRQARGQRIRHARQHGMSLGEVARLLGLSRRRVCQICQASQN